MPALGLKLLDKLYMWEASMLPVVKLFQVEASYKHAGLVKNTSYYI